MLHEGAALPPDLVDELVRQGRQVGDDPLVEQAPPLGRRQLLEFLGAPDAVVTHTHKLQVGV